MLKRKSFLRPSAMPMAAAFFAFFLAVANAATGDGSAEPFRVKSQEPMGAAAEKRVSPRTRSLQPDAIQALPSALRPGAAALSQRLSAMAADVGSTLPVQAGKIPGAPPLHPLGLIPAAPVKAPAAQSVLEAVLSERAAKAGMPAQGIEALVSLLPPSWDNSAGLPPVGDQGAQNSCVPWAAGYYLKTYQEGRERGWSLADPAHQFSPAYLYNQLQYFDEGSTMQDNFDLLADQGCASLATMPYLDADFRTWPSAAVYREGIPYRALSYDYLGYGETFQLFDAIKAILSSGDLCVVGLPIYRRGPTEPGRFDLLTATDYEYDLPPASDIYLAGYHALAIIGYDESKFGGTGGYKIVNSWGTAWGNRGFAWISERFLTTFGFDFHRMTDRIGYVPTGFAHWTVSHSFWAWNEDNVTVRIGVGPINMPLWSKMMITGLVRDALTVDMWYDITEGVAYLPPNWTNRWWISVEDHSMWDSGSIQRFDVETSGVLYSGATPLPLGTLDGTSNYAVGVTTTYVPCGESPASN